MQLGERGAHFYDAMFKGVHKTSISARQMGMLFGYRTSIQTFSGHVVGRTIQIPEILVHYLSHDQ